MNVLDFDAKVRNMSVPAEPSEAKKMAKLTEKEVRTLIDCTLEEIELDSDVLNA